MFSVLFPQTGDIFYRRAVFERLAVFAISVLIIINTPIYDTIKCNYEWIQRREVFDVGPPTGSVSLAGNLLAQVFTW